MEPTTASCGAGSASSSRMPPSTSATVVAADQPSVDRARLATGRPAARLGWYTRVRSTTDGGEKG